MAYTIQCNGTFTATIGNPINIPLSINVYVTGSNDKRVTQPVATGTWQALDTSSLSNVRYFVADNISTASIAIATDSAGTKLIGTLQPNDNIVTPWTGSMSLYVQSYISASVLQYYLINP